MQAASTFSRTEIASGHASSGRVTILRCADDAVLGESVRDCVWSLAGGRARELVIPAGPYRYAYAAALQIANQFQSEGQAGRTQEEPGLNRIDIAHLLRPLVRANVVLGVPRLDALDAESVQLLASLVWFAELSAKSGLDAPLTLVAGITEDAPTLAMRKLLQLKCVHCADVATDSRRSVPQVSADQRPLLALLAAAPHPLPVDLVAACLGRSADSLSADLATLAAAGIVDTGELIGQGTAFACAQPDPDEVETARHALLDRGALNLPDARLAVAGSNEPELARQLGQRALDRGEPEIALRCFRYSGRGSVTGRGEPDLAYATALAEIGAHDGAVAIFRSMEDHKFTQDEVFQFGLLGSRLAEAGVLSRQQADQAMRKAERENRGAHIERAVQMRILRSNMMLRYNEGPRALTLLRRVVREQLDQVTGRVRLDYQIALARAYAAAGSRRFAERTLLQAREEAATASQLLEIERALLQVLPQEDSMREESERRALRIASQNLDAAGAERLIGSRAPLWLSEVLSEAFEGTPESSYSAAPRPRDGCAALFGWLHKRGATLLATWSGGQMQIYPVGATARPGLVGWLQSALQRLVDYPDAMVSACYPVPNAGPYAGDLVLHLARWGSEGPAVALLRREDVADLNDLLEALSRAD